MLSLVIAGPVASADAAFPGRNGRIAYQQWRTIGPGSPQSKIVSVLPNGRRRRTLLGRFGAKPSYFAGPAYSPHGRKLAFSFARFGPPIGRSSLYVVRADGRGRRRRLTHPRRADFDLGPAWAPDGARLAYIRSLDVRVYRAGRSRSIGQEANHLSWSVRGQIAFANEPGGSAASEPSIYIMRPDGSHMRRIVESGGAPDWSPNGRWIVYTVPGWLGGLGPAPPSPSLYKTSIALVRRDGSDRRVLTDHDGGREPAFSPDGKYIVFTRFDDVSLRDTLVVMRLSDRRTRTIVTTPPAVLGAPDRYEQHGLNSSSWQPLSRRRHR